MAQNPKPNLFSKALAATKRAFFYALEWRTIVIWIASSVLATYSGPFGTYLNYTSLELFATWLLLIGAAILTAYVIYELCQTFLSDRSPLMRPLVFFCVGSISIGLSVDFLLVNLFGHTEPTKPTRILLIFYSLAIMCFVQIVRKVLLRGADYKDFAKLAGEPIQEAADCRLARRLEIPKGARINHVSANGHFIEVATCAEKFKTRMRFSDAVAELDDAIGLTIHRSHWVNRAAIRGWVLDAKKPYVVLENDVRVPVSKSNFDKVANAGLPKLQNDAMAS